MQLSFKNRIHNSHNPNHAGPCSAVVSIHTSSSHHLVSEHQYPAGAHRAGSFKHRLGFGIQ